MARPAGNISVATSGTFSGLVKRAIVVEGGDQLKEIVGGAVGTLNNPSTDASWPTDGTHGKGFNVPESGNAYVDFGDLADVGGGTETVMILYLADVANSPGVSVLSRMVYKQGGGDDYCDINRAANETFSAKLGVGAEFGASSTSPTWSTSSVILLGVSYDGTNQLARHDSTKSSNLDKSVGGAITNDTTQDLLIGNDTGGNGAAGTIFSVVWFNTALDDTQWGELVTDPWAWAEAGSSSIPGLIKSGLTGPGLTGSPLIG